MRERVARQGSTPFELAEATTGLYITFPTPGGQTGPCASQVDAVGRMGKSRDERDTQLRFRFDGHHPRS